jgi:hypothetical protein
MRNVLFDGLGLISTVMLTKSFPLQRKSRTQIDFSRRMLGDALGYMLIWKFFFFFNWNVIFSLI